MPDRPVADIHADLDDVDDKIKAKLALRARLRRQLDRVGDRLPALKKRKRKLRKELKRVKGGRRKPNVVVDALSPNRSSRGGVTPRLMVLHSTESTPAPGTDADLKSIAAYFGSSSAQASSHVLTDDDGDSGRCVPDAEKAWTQAYFNPWSLSIEQIGRAAQSEWPDEQLRESARWLAKWSNEFGIPLVRGSVSGSTITRAGVVTHKQLGSVGGGHVDPGDGYPVDRVIEMAKQYR
jgi:hypothetical protein